jgi:class 3 adenylate cyclase/CHASE2 domain-containing sensor protein
MQPAESTVAVIALDTRSLHHARLATLPRPLFAPFHAEVLERLMEAGARAVGFDLVFAWSGNAMAEALPGFPHDYDAPFLEALRRYRERIVLAEHGETAIIRNYRYWVTIPPNPWVIGRTEVFADEDGIYRRVPTWVTLQDTTQHPTLAGALAVRAGASPGRSSIELIPRLHPASIPTYAFIDILACDDAAALAAAVRDKVILIGGTLASEDSVLTPARFLTGPRTALAEGTTCPPQPLGASQSGAALVPGVYLHALAVDAILRGDVGRPAAAIVGAVLTGLGGLIGACLGLGLRPWAATTAAAAFCVAVFLGTCVSLAAGIVLSAVPIMAMVAGAIVVAWLTRFLVEERRQRVVRRAFGHYLPPMLVDCIADEDLDLTLGGDTRDVTIMFADLSGFTALSGKVPPSVLMTVTNRYLAEITGAVEETGGYVDKYIGDAVMGLWGAPADDARHPEHAARGALEALHRVEQLRRVDEAQQAPAYSVKIGINTGRAIVGNVGAPDRYNYTVVGETVNIAARLESTPEDYGCRIVIGPEMAQRIRGEFLVYELDWIQLKGKQEPIAIFELLCPLGEANAKHHTYVQGYATALRHYRTGRFEEARIVWLALQYPLAEGNAQAISPPFVMAERAATMAMAPQESEWNGVYVKKSK